MQVLQKTQTIVRYQQQNGKVYYGTVEDDEIIQMSSSFSDIANDRLAFDGTRMKYSDVKILEPVVPSKIINFGWTYAGHAEETGGQANLKEPFLFLKPASSVIPHLEEIILPSNDLTRQVEMEGEVALVIGKRGRNIKEEEALDYIFGCTIFNDVTARDLTKHDPQFTRGKGFDTFGPLGPCIVRGIDPTNLQITTTLNGKVVQEGNTNQMSLSIPFLISWISQVMTLEPGDVLATGSPSGSCPMESGDVVAVEVEQIGKLCNYVK
ncbi:fumarylacetoacetate hydrolase family protein [Bacillus thermotolerans]|uniref:Fumarylacetoacetate hydrolase family protein n=1 Tax=Bacillus thermotolerans TaxID=1221996 RepID=A0A0F5HQ67_BACTR|nr:fumarylacetoacetate hydrolase family protein [Bacillus thermotolerans]KKB33566.1 Fumarylacetoacetate hydrolase family protein [Bacillus thermotolerans]KKB35165.1 Fumarylacetoacetate hydrolase family protein [Bacillus thermotolerans]KKB38145.1 Fumarylacetoacetate hydrolase family protein [Bacillus thermotolerans]